MNKKIPSLHLLPPQRVANGDQIAPLQYKVGDTARLLSVSDRTVKRLIKRGELASIGKGRMLRVPFDSIVDYQNRHRNDGGA